MLCKLCKLEEGRFVTKEQVIHAVMRNYGAYVTEDIINDICDNGYKCGMTFDQIYVGFIGSMFVVAGSAFFRKLIVGMGKLDIAENVIRDACEESIKRAFAEYGEFNFG